MVNTVDFTALFFIYSGIGCAIYIWTDLCRYRQSMKIMNVVWVLTGLWGSYLALWGYLKWGRNKRPPMMMDNKMAMPMDMPMDMDKEKPHWQSVALSTLHCGAGCTLADILGRWFTSYIPIEIGGSLIAGEWVLDYILALIIGVYFQYYAIREMEQISVGKGLIRAFKADFFSLTSWQIGMYGWMAIVYFILYPYWGGAIGVYTFWFMMQIAMLFGFICAYPMNAWLIKRGIKMGM